MTMPTLEASHLFKSFALPHPPWRRAPLLTAVVDISLTLNRGKILGIVGESGCGKSTLARLLSGALTADKGCVKLLGKDLAKHSSRTRAQGIQLMFQDPGAALHPRFTVEQALMEPLQKVLGLDGQAARLQIEELLQQLHLPRLLLPRYPHELSGGQKQRVCLARALTMKPAIMVCDEPLTALDRITQVQVLELLDRLRRDLGLSFIFISHDIALVRLLADQVAVMYKGRWVETGPTRAVLHQPQHPYTRYLLQSMPKLYRDYESKIPAFTSADLISEHASEACPASHRCPMVQAACRDPAVQPRSLLAGTGDAQSTCVRAGQF